MANETTTSRLLRLSISIYRNQNITSKEGHDFARNNHAIKAAPIHAQHGIDSYSQVCTKRDYNHNGMLTRQRIKFFTPINYRKTLEDMNTRGNRGWVIDDHDLTIDFYFKTFADLAKVNTDRELQRLQQEEEPFINRTHTVVSLGWVEQYVKDGKVVNIKDGKSMYPTFEELTDLATAAGSQAPASGA